MLHKIWAAGLAVAALGWGGGFWITTHSGASPLAAKIPGTAVVIAVEGCANPKDATLAGTAEGLVGGRRQSVKLEFTPTSKPGVFAVKKQWPTEGVWVLSITGAYVGHTSRQLVELLPNHQYKAQPVIPKENLAGRIEQALRGLAGRAT